MMSIWKRRDQVSGDGVQNSGSMSNVQNQPHAMGSVQSQGGTPPTPSCCAR
ncbi:hypothetical protein GXW82_32935 [Streptacidiphilus sp. 4-A2]|nr:hypothetical protein [Streptacidiphilus sp. 4-A2]